MEQFMSEGSAMSSDETYRAELDVAESAARAAGAVIMSLFKGKYDVKEKSKNNPVTTADLEANRVIRASIEEKFHGDAWLSEEDTDNSRRLGTSRLWVIDPIDGTKEFIEGVPQFAVSIGFVVDGRVKVAVVYNPAKDRLYKAVAGDGAYLNDQPIRVSPRSEVGGAKLLVSRSEPARKFQIFVDR
jgi:fructose-1,6-bisphosphatase/inositol monophosphatase family enzyme